MMKLRSLLISLCVALMVATLALAQVQVEAPLPRSLIPDESVVLFDFAARAIDSSSALGRDPVFQIHQVLVRWRAAWQEQEVDDYLGFYAESFDPGDGTPRSSWLEQRRLRVGEPGFIRVALSEIEVAFDGAATAATRARASFRQDFASDRLSDSGLKTLTLQRDGEGWRIVDETWQALAP